MQSKVTFRLTLVSYMINIRDGAPTARRGQEDSDSDFHLCSLAALPENSVKEIPRLNSQWHNTLSSML